MQAKLNAFNKLYGTGGAFYMLNNKTDNNRALVKEAKNACNKAWMESEGMRLRRPGTAPARQGTGNVLKRVKNIEARRPNSARARRPQPGVSARRPNSARARRPNSTRARLPKSITALLQIVAGLLPIVGGGPTVLVPHRKPDIVFNNRSPCYHGTRTISHFQKP
jgi:hypothetical protein